MHHLVKSIHETKSSFLRFHQSLKESLGEHGLGGRIEVTGLE